MVGERGEDDMVGTGMRDRAKGTDKDHGGKKEEKIGVIEGLAAPTESETGPATRKKNEKLELSDRPTDRKTKILTIM